MLKHSVEQYGEINASKPTMNNEHDIMIIRLLN